MKAIRRISIPFILVLALAWGLCLSLSAPAAAQFSGEQTGNRLDVINAAQAIANMEPQRQYPMNNVIGRNLIVAEQALFYGNPNGMANLITKSIPTKDKNKNQIVCSQSPAPGQMVYIPLVVNVTLTYYQLVAIMPTVMTLTLDKAKAALIQLIGQDNSSYIITTPHQTKDKKKDHIVYSQSPTPGVTFDVGHQWIGLDYYNF